MARRPSSSPRRDPVEPVPRCCPRHSDWPTLAEHLVEAFPRLSPADVALEVRFARDAVQGLVLLEDTMFIGELIARYRLLVRAGDLPDVARLDPQSHPRRAPQGAVDA